MELQHPFILNTTVDNMMDLILLHRKLQADEFEESMNVAKGWQAYLEKLPSSGLQSSASSSSFTFFGII
jgi:hypothetical protein